MAAGQGYIEFATGDVLTAAAANGYLASQVVMVFASAAARTSAIASPQEGMISYLKDTNATEYYSGTAWVAVGGSSPLTTKGDLYTYSTTNARLGVGTNGQVLTADSAEATGLKWATVGGSSGPAFFAKRTGSQQSLSSSVATKLQYNSEDFDTDNCYDSTTNYRFTPNKAGYYQFNCGALMTGGSMTAAEVTFRKNNTAFASGSFSAPTSGYNGAVCSAIVYLNGSTDYVEVFGTNYGGGNLEISTTTVFNGVWIRS